MIGKDEMNMYLESCEKKYLNKEVFSNISYYFKNEVYFLAGKNGSGKSTLMRCLCKFEPFTSGIFKSDNKKILYLPDKSLTQKFLTIYENIQLLYALHGIRINDDIKKCIHTMFNEEQLYTLAEKASLGMTLKVGCSLIFARKHWDFIAIDETLSSIDIHSRDIIIDNCLQLTDEGVSTIIIHHGILSQRFDNRLSKLLLTRDKLCEVHTSV